MNQGRPASDATLLAQTANLPIRPSSDFYGQSHDLGHGNSASDSQEWLADIDQYESTLVEMAEATQDQEFKEELAAIEQWFLVLSEAERTAAMYALLQQTTRVQTRFFSQVLQQKEKSHPVPGILSPTTFDKDPMSSRLDGAMNRLSVADSTRNSVARPSSTARHSALDPAEINKLFPDAAAALASEKAKFTQQTGKVPTSNRNSLVDNRNSLAAPSISAPKDDQTNPQSPWGPNDASRPKSSSGQAPMGQFSIQAPPNTGGLRSPRPPQLSSNTNIQSTTLENKPRGMSDMQLPLLSPYGGSGNWASMVNTPMVPNFNTGQGQADMVANAALMKLSALSTVNNRVALDDVRKYRRARSNDPAGASQAQPMAPTQFVMINPQGQVGQVLTQEQLIAARNQQTLGFGGRSRPSSPGLAMQGGFAPGMAFTSPQYNGRLAAFDGSSPILNNGLSPTMGMNMGVFGSFGGNEGYLSDHSEIMRGRSPRGRRGTSKPPEDPTDPTLLQDIPSWLRSLRLHKYTDVLKDMQWTDLVELDDEALQARGVNALGARRKMLKVFEQVKGKTRSD
jgi:hypothetical protein